MTAHFARSMGLDLLMLQETFLMAQPNINQEDLGSGWIVHTSADQQGNGRVGILVSLRLRHLVIDLPKSDATLTSSGHQAEDTECTRLW